jgi:hypothetical protein
MELSVLDPALCIKVCLLPSRAQVGVPCERQCQSLLCLSLHKHGGCGESGDGVDQEALCKVFQHSLASTGQRDFSMGHSELTQKEVFPLFLLTFRVSEFSLVSPSLHWFPPLPFSFLFFFLSILGFELSALSF